MLGTFSFGKILKTVLPGFLLTASFLLAVEIVGWKYSNRSMLWYLCEKDRFAAVVTLLVPLLLIFGFLLNTVIWACVNPTMRARARAEVDKDFKGLREVIYRKRNEGLAELGFDSDSAPQSWPRESFEYYFLNSVENERLMHLWESYYSWYEFHINSAYAIPFFSCSAFLYLFTVNLFGLGPFVNHRYLPESIILSVLLIGIAIGCYKCLRETAYRNLVQYDKNLLLLIAGSFRNAAGAAK